MLSQSAVDCYKIIVKGKRPVDDYLDEWRRTMSASAVRGFKLDRSFETTSPAPEKILSHGTLEAGTERISRARDATRGHRFSFNLHQSSADW